MTLPESEATVYGLLGTLLEFPQDPEARLAVAQILMQECPELDQAIGVCRMFVVVFDYWPGPATLQRFIEVWKNPGRFSVATVTTKCERCDGGRISDTGGGIADIAGPRRYEYCDCPMGRDLKRVEERSSIQLEATPGGPE